MGKNLISRIILCIFVFIIGTVFVFYLSTYVHLFLAGDLEGLRAYDAVYILDSFRMEPNHVKLFACLEVLVLLMSGYCLLIDNKPYQSEMMVVTPDISTPKPAGQKQYGSARWMTEAEKSKSFQVIKISKHDHLMMNLIEQALIEVDQIRVDKSGGDIVESNVDE